MNDDLFQSVPQGGIGAQEAENRRIEAIADELRRRCKLYETQRRDGQSYVSPFEAEQRVAELFAKECGLWIPMEQVFNLVSRRLAATVSQPNMFMKGLLMSRQSKAPTIC